MPRCVAPATSRVGTAASDVVGCEAALRISVRLALLTLPTSPTRRVTTPTEPGGTTTAGTSVQVISAGFSLYVPGVSTLDCTPLYPSGTTSDSGGAAPSFNDCFSETTATCGPTDGSFRLPLASHSQRSGSPAGTSTCFTTSHSYSTGPRTDEPSPSTSCWTPLN